jgi:hypothetical protein
VVDSAVHRSDKFEESVGERNELENSKGGECRERDRRHTQRSERASPPAGEESERRREEGEDVEQRQSQLRDRDGHRSKVDQAIPRDADERREADRAEQDEVAGPVGCVARAV